MSVLASDLKNMIINENLTYEQLSDLYYKELESLINLESFISINKNTESSYLFGWLFQEEMMLCSKPKIYNRRNVVKHKKQEEIIKILSNNIDSFSQYYLNYSDGRTEYNKVLFNKNNFSTDFFTNLKSIISETESLGMKIIPLCLMICYFEGIKTKKGVVSLSKNLSKEKQREKDEKIKMSERSIDIFRSKEIQDWLQNIVDNNNESQHDNLLMFKLNEYICLTENHLFRYESEKNIESLRQALNLISAYGERNSYNEYIFKIDNKTSSYNNLEERDLEYTQIKDNGLDLANRVMESISAFALTQRYLREEFKQYKTPKNTMEEEIIEILNEMKGKKKVKKQSEFIALEMKVEQVNKKVIRAIMRSNYFNSSINGDILKITDENNEEVGKCIIHCLHKPLLYDVAEERILSFIMYDKSLGDDFWSEFLTLIPKEFFTDSKGIEESEGKLALRLLSESYKTAIRLTNLVEKMDGDNNITKIKKKV